MRLLGAEALVVPAVDAALAARLGHAAAPVAVHPHDRRQRAVRQLRQRTLGRGGRVADLFKDTTNTVRSAPCSVRGSTTVKGLLHVSHLWVVGRVGEDTLEAPDSPLIHGAVDDLRGGLARTRAPIDAAAATPPEGAVAEANRDLDQERSVGQTERVVRGIQPAVLLAI